MGRQGGGGGHSSGGSRSHSGSRSHGSSRSHSSRGGGRSTGPSFSGSSFHMPRSTWRPSYTRSYRPYRTGHRTVVYPSGGSSIIGILVILVLLTAVLLPFFNGMKGGSNIAPSTIPRERLETQHAYVNDCVMKVFPACRSAQTPLSSWTAKQKRSSGITKCPIGTAGTPMTTTVCSHISSTAPLSVSCTSPRPPRT